MPITPSLRHCSNKYKLAREGDKDKEKDDDIEKGKEFLFIFMMKSSSVERDDPRNDQGLDKKLCSMLCQKGPDLSDVV